MISLLLEKQELMKLPLSIVMFALLSLLASFRDWNLVKNWLLMSIMLPWNYGGERVS
jgi:hypothetical protein